MTAKKRAHPSPSPSAKTRPGGEVFVLCPAGAVTGGPDALHQLVHAARSLGYAAHMVYQPTTAEVPEPYRGYDLSIRATVADSPNNAVVSPEIWPNFVAAFPRSKKVFWWLSWDYGAASFDEVDRAGVLHACQSAYALDMVRKSSMRTSGAMLLGDFTRWEFGDSARRERRDIVAYYPTKGVEFSQRLIAENPDLTFVPIENMTPSEVHDLLSEAKVYIDFGHHPGKDRIPREAAASGCCVITSSDRGASAFREDVPIPKRYKFPTRVFRSAQVSAAIRDCLENYDERVADFDLYRASVRAEHWIFLEQVEELMEKLGCQRTTG